MARELVTLPTVFIDHAGTVDTITRALADAREQGRREGAEEMRERAVRACRQIADHSPGLHTESGVVGARLCAVEIRALTPEKP